MEKKVTKTTTLLQFLSEIYPDSSNRTIKNLLQYGSVFVDQKKCSIGTTSLTKGQLVTVCKKRQKQPLEFNILYEDKHIIVIDKPCGMLSFPLDKKPSKNVLDLLRKYCQNSTVYAVHRLDKETSGVLLFAKTTQACKTLNIYFKKNIITREYLALVEGNNIKQEGIWSWKLYEATNQKVYVSFDKGKTAITKYKKIKQKKLGTKLMLTLDTGRKHQIRVHAQKAGFPVIGDTKYGSLQDPFQRLCLHANAIVFPHPITKKPLRIQSKIRIPF